MTNKSWYKINREKDCFEILDSAPAKAKLSFEIWSGKRKTLKKKKIFFLSFFQNLNSSQIILFQKEAIPIGMTPLFYKKYYPFIFMSQKESFKTISQQF